MANDEPYAADRTSSSELSAARRFVVLVALVSALGGALFGYDTGVISGALLFITDQFGLTPVMEGVVTSALLIGAALGAVAGGRAADRIGRRSMLILSAIVFIAATLGCALTPSVPVLVLSRFVLGTAVGAASVIVPLYISEMAPARVRGKLVTFNALMIVTGQLMAYLVNAALAESGAWRWMLGLATVPAVLLWVGMLFLPDSPRWYVGKERFAEALAVLERSRPSAEARTELDSITELRRREAAERGGWKDLRETWLKRLFLTGVGLAIFQQVTGVNTIVYFAPKLLTRTGLGEVASIVASVSIGVVSVLAATVGLLLMDRVGRRPMLLAGNASVSACLVLLGLVSFLPSESLATSYLTLGLMVVYMACFQSTVNTVTWLMISEMFPLRIRGFAMGAAVFVLWMANFAVALVFSPMVASIGAGWTFWVFAVFGACAVVFTHRMIPETRGRSLEELESEMHARYSGASGRGAGVGTRSP